MISTGGWRLGPNAGRATQYLGAWIVAETADHADVPDTLCFNRAAALLNRIFTMLAGSSSCRSLPIG